MFCLLQVGTSQPWWDLFPFNMYPGCSLWSVLAFVNLVFSTVQCFIPWDGGCCNPAGLFRIFTYKSSNNHFLWSIFSINKNGKLLFPLCLSPSSFLCFFSQENIPTVMREGIDEMLQYEKKTVKTERIYTYEKAVERYYSTRLVKLNERLQHTLNLKGQFVKRWYQSQKHSLCITTGKC